MNKKVQSYKEFLNEGLLDKMKPKSKEEIEKNIEELNFEMYGVDLDEKGNFGQDLTDIYAAKSEDLFYKLGQIRVLKDLIIFYPDRSIEDGRLRKYYINELDGLRELTKDEKMLITIELNREKKLGSSLLDNSVSYLDVVKNIIN